jgi:NTP pyrophosphatase (non-canonical NTP hydrolase)
MNFDEYMRQAHQTAKYPPEIGLLYVTLGLNGEAGEIAEKVKKLYRDNNGALTDEIRASIAKEIGDVLWYTAMMCREIGVSLDDVARQNIEKLSDRQKRGMISGSGDER